MAAVVFRGRRTHKAGAEVQSPGGHVLQWEAPAMGGLPGHLVTRCLTAVRGDISPDKFGPPSVFEIERLEGWASQLSSETKFQITVDMLLSMRKSDSIHRAGLANRRHDKRSEIVAQFAAGESVMSISRSMELPPMFVLKQLLIERGLSSAKMYSALHDLGVMASVNKRLGDELADILISDYGSWFHGNRTKTEATLFEKKLELYMTQHGVKFTTEDELRAHDTEESDDNTAMSTPDLVFKEPIIINGRKIYWMDAKHYFWYNTLMLTPKLVKQATKYNEEFGPGAMVFAHGFTKWCKSDLFSVTYLLDGSNIEKLTLPAAL